MATEPEIIAQLRFALDQLSARNGHHEFEHLCRHLARRTICTNILPATGPVAAGGDQGRDFETFRTYLSSASQLDSSFLGRSSETAIAFACTLQRQKIPAKVRADVQLIMASPIRPEAVHVFLAQDLPTAIRHELQTWAHDQYTVHLEVHDAQAISEVLCDPEHFWIAEEFLSIPRTFRPERRPDQVEEWYKTAVERWTPDKAFHATPANFHELSSAVRHATYTDEVKSDVPMWIRRLEAFRTSDDCPPSLARWATYEIAVAALRGLGTLHGREGEVRSYFDAIPDLQVPADLEDASVLMVFCRGAMIRDAIQIGAEELDVIRDRIAAQLDARLAVENSVTIRCALLETRGYLSLFASSSDSPHPPDLEPSLQYWSQMLEFVVDAPMYPLERFADRLTEMIRLVGDVPSVERLTQRLDGLLSDRFGGFIAAEKCRDRALAFYEGGRILRGINELHQAKIGWFADETLRGCLLAMLLLAEWYRELGLTFASKQYALGVAFIVFDTPKTELKRYLPEALLSAASCDYMQGHWCDFLGRTHFTLGSAQLVPNQDRTEEAIDSQLKRILYHTAIVLMISERMALEIHAAIVKTVHGWKLHDYFDVLMPKVQRAWADQSEDQIWVSLEEQLQGRPFGDVSDVVVTTWRQLGLLWEVSYANESRTIGFAEQFIATCQIVMAEWAGIDLCLLRTRIRVDIQLNNDLEEPDLSPRPSNEGRSWILKLPAERSHSGSRDIQIETLAIAMEILSEVSLLPEEQLHRQVESTFRDGISAKVMAARPYHELYFDLTPDPRVFDRERRVWSVPKYERPFVSREHEAMGWFDGPGPGYTRASSEEGIRNRYARGLRPARITIKRLSTIESFMEVVRRLQKQGWRDWHFVLAIANIVLDYRVVQPGARKRKSPDSINQSLTDALEKDESYDDIWVPTCEFSEDALWRTLRVSQISTLGGLGLRCRQRTPDFGAIDDFLRHRYRYWDDDVEHTSLFQQ